MSERLRNIDEKGILERVGSVVLGILGWSASIRQEIKNKTSADKQSYSRDKSSVI